jgi:uncharacterized membrane protein HdeD (DUF308 family)
MNILLLILSLVDIIAGIIIIVSPNLILSGIAGYVGWALLIKGIWSMFFGLS